MSSIWYEGRAGSNEHSSKIGRGEAFYAVIAALGAAYALLENHPDRLVHFIEELMPAFLILALVIAVYCVFRTMVSALRELDGVSETVHVTLYANYCKT